MVFVISCVIVANGYSAYRLRHHTRRWIVRARAKLMNKEKSVKPIGFHGKRSMDMFRVHASSMNCVSVSQVLCDVWCWALVQRVTCVNPQVGVAFSHLHSQCSFVLALPPTSYNPAPRVMVWHGTSSATQLLSPPPLQKQPHCHV